MKINQITLRLFLLLAVLLVKNRIIYGQINRAIYQLKGIIEDSLTHQGLAYITVRLKDDKETAVKAVISEENGSFTISSLEPLHYSVVVVGAGYEQKSIQLDLSKSEIKSVDIGVIYLGEQVKHLKEVFVTADHPIIKQRADRIVYDLRADPESKSNSVLGIMRKIPFISMDGEDNILLKGNSSFKVLINGKPSRSLEDNLKAILRSMPASTIEKIEVITTPPSKYDAEGLVGIINIITIKNLSDGFNGTLNGNWNFPIGGPGVGGSFTGKKGKFGISAFGGGSIFNSPQTSYNNSRVTFNVAPTNLVQGGFHKSNNKTIYFGTELSYESDSLHLLTSQINFNGSRSTDNISQASNLSGSSGILQQYDLLNNNKATGYGIDAGINYQIGFKASKNRLLTLSYRYSTNLNNRNNNVALSKHINFTVPDYRQNNHQQFREHTIQLDFVTALKRLNIEGGLKGIIRNNNSDFGYSSLNSTNGQFDTDLALSNDYTNTQNVFSAYNSYQIAVKSWNINTGVRVEQTVIRAIFLSTATVAKQNYFNVIPSIAISKNFKDQSSINFGFSQRIRRPGINRLNPYVDRSNPNFESTGNPNLRPVLLNDISVGYGSNKKLSVNMGLDYSFMNNLDLQIANFDPNTQVTRTSYANTGKSSSFGGNFYVGYPISKAWNVSLNGNVMYLRLEGIVDGALINNNRLMYSLALSNGFHFNKGWGINADLNVISRNPTGLQGYSNGFVSTAFSANKEIVNNKLSFSAGVKNPFTKYRDNITKTFGHDFNQLYKSRDYYRSFSIGLNYNFGSLKDGITKSKKVIENNDMSN